MKKIIIILMMIFTFKYLNNNVLLFEQYYNSSVLMDQISILAVEIYIIYFSTLAFDKIKTIKGKR